MDIQPEPFAAGRRAMPGSGLPLAAPTTGSKTPDPAWIETTFTWIFEAERSALLRWLRFRMHDDDAAEDCCQEAFARLLGELRAGRCPQTPGAWLHLVARNLLVSRARHAQVVARQEQMTVEAQGGDPTAGSILDRERWLEVRLALDTIPRAERDLLLRAAGGQTGAQLAGRLGVSPIAVRTRLSRARRHLRTMLDDDAIGGTVQYAGTSLR